MLLGAYVKLCKDQNFALPGQNLLYNYCMETNFGADMNAGDVVTLLVRDSTGKLVSGDFVKIDRLFAATAIVHYLDNMASFTVMRFKLR